MRKKPVQLDWCIVRLGEDYNWWVDEISDPINWDVDGLAIIDPRQVGYIIDLIDPLRDYGFQTGIFESAFFSFSISGKASEGRVRLKRSFQSILDAEDQLFILPDILNEETGPYADFLDHITKLRVKMLNDLIEFDQPLTVDELEEELREEQNFDFMEGRAIHFFSEIIKILEYVPQGFELEIDESDTLDDNEEDEVDLEGDFPDIEEEDDSIEQDETMKWDEEGDEDEEEDEDTDLAPPILDEEFLPEEEDDEDEEEDFPVAKKKPSTRKKNAASSPKKAPKKRGSR